MKSTFLLFSLIVLTSFLWACIAQNKSDEFFIQTEDMEGIRFEVKTYIEDDQRMLQIKSNGLSAVNENAAFPIDGKVLSAEVADLNSDGYPELLIFLSSENNCGDVIAYSVNNGKSMSQIYFPSLDLHGNLDDGYEGCDSYKIVNNTLQREFPIYNSNHHTTGQLRQIEYTLVDGEASRHLIVKRVAIISEWQ